MPPNDDELHQQPHFNIGTRSYKSCICGCTKCLDRLARCICQGCSCRDTSQRVRNHLPAEQTIPKAPVPPETLGTPIAGVAQDRLCVVCQEPVVKISTKGRWPTKCPQHRTK